MYSLKPYVVILLYITEVLEEVDQDSDLDIIKKAKDYYKGCINKGQSILLTLHAG